MLHNYKRLKAVTFIDVVSAAQAYETIRTRTHSTSVSRMCEAFGPRRTWRGQAFVVELTY